MTMTAKEYLRQYEQAVRQAKRMQNEYERELDLIDSVRSTLGGDGMPHGSGISKRVEDQAIRLADKAAQWKMAQLDALHLAQEVFETISKVPDIDGDILYERYINLHKWEDICVLLHISWYSVHDHHRRALRMVDELIKST
jgi:DNA-directed RNA polymerase specialized sigma24 family protein